MRDCTSVSFKQVFQVETLALPLVTPSSSLLLVSKLKVEIKQEKNKKEKKKQETHKSVITPRS